MPNPTTAKQGHSWRRYFDSAVAGVTAQTSPTATQADWQEMSELFA